jgi:hypothetical protein
MPARRRQAFGRSLPITRPLRAWATTALPTYGVDSAWRSASIWRQVAFVALEDVQHPFGAHPGGLERDRGDAVGA